MNYNDARYLNRINEDDRPIMVTVTLDKYRELCDARDKVRESASKELPDDNCGLREPNDAAVYRLYNEMIAQKDRAEAAELQVKELKDSLAYAAVKGLTDELEVMRDNYEALARELDRLKDELENVRHDYDALLENKSRYKGRVWALEDQLENARRNYDALAKDRDWIKGQLDLSKKRIEELERQIEASKLIHTKLEDEIAGLKRELADANVEITRLKISSYL